MAQVREPNIREITVTFAKGLMPKVLEWNPEIKQMLVDFYTENLMILMNTRIPEIREAKDIEQLWDEAETNDDEPQLPDESYDDLSFTLASDIMDMYYDCHNIPEKVLEYDQHTLHYFIEYVKECVYMW